MAGSTFADLKSNVDTLSLSVNEDLSRIATDQAKLAADQGLLASAASKWAEAVVVHKGLVAPNTDGTFAVYTPDGKGSVALAIYPPLSAEATSLPAS